MNSLQQFRVWRRRGSTRSKMFFWVEVVIVLGLVVWLLVPGSAASAASPATAARGAAFHTGKSDDVLTASSKSCPTGSDQGLTPKTMKVAIGLIDIPGINAAFDIPLASQQQSWYGLVINALNRQGGIACRHIVPAYYHVNEIDANSLEQNCLDIVASKPFAYLDDGAYLLASQKNCFPVGQVPFIGTSGVTDQQAAQYYPYFLVSGGSDSQTMRNAFDAFKAQGLFTAAKGFKKEGVIYRDCTTTTGPSALEDLHDAGVKTSQIVTYDIGCPTSTDSPSDLLQAIVSFKHAGVTDVSALDMVSDFPVFTRLAEQQGFHPKYIMPDYGYIATSGPTAQKPDTSNLVGAELVSSGSFGFEPEPTSATKWCNAVYTAAGQPTLYKQDAGLGGVICDNLLLLKAAADNAPKLLRTDLAAGIEKAGVVDYSWPLGPADYRGHHVTFGGQYWHSVEFSASCQCWKPLQAQWQLPYS